MTQQKLEQFIKQNRKICWESEYENDEYCIGENKVRQFFESIPMDAEVKPESGGLSLEVMIDNLPQNRVLYKDSGLWMIINEEDFNTVDKMLFQVAKYQQTTEETFTQFIKRCFDNENEYYITEGQPLFGLTFCL